MPRTHQIKAASLTAIALVVICLGSMARHAEAAGTAVSYNLAGTPGSLAPSTTAANVISNNIDFTGSSASQSATTQFLGLINASNAQDEASAVSNNSYFEFAVAP